MFINNKINKQNKYVNLNLSEQMILKISACLFMLRFMCSMEYQTPYLMLKFDFTDETLTDTTTLGQSELWNNGNEKILHIFTYYRLGWLVGWLVVGVWILWHINLCRLFNPKSIFIQIISSISNNSVQHECTV